MDEDVATWKLVGAYLVWLIASVAIALVVALLVGAVVALFTSNPQSAGDRRLIEIVSVVAFVVLAAVPFLIRSRIVDGGTGDE